MENKPTKITIPRLLARKARGEKISMLTAYDATMARLLDRAGIDMLLVGDTLGMVVLGYETTLPVTLDMMVHHTRAVTNGAKRALVVADLPFLTYQTSPADALRNAGRLMQEGGAQAVKLEGGAAVAETVERLTGAGIPVMGHVGLTPQSVHALGGFRAVGKESGERQQVLEDARLLQHAGAFAVVLEAVPASLAGDITTALTIPTIGIGAGPNCDGQVLVSYDALGLFDSFVPKFVKRYAHLNDEITSAAQQYMADVQDGTFPGPEHSIGQVEPSQKCPS